MPLPSVLVVATPPLVRLSSKERGTVPPHVGGGGTRSPAAIRRRRALTMTSIYRRVERERAPTDPLAAAAAAARISGWRECRAAEQKRRILLQPGSSVPGAQGHLCHSAYLERGCQGEAKSSRAHLFPPARSGRLARGATLNNAATTNRSDSVRQSIFLFNPSLPIPPILTSPP